MKTSLEIRELSKSIQSSDYFQGQDMGQHDFQLNQLVE